MEKDGYDFDGVLFHKYWDIKMEHLASLKRRPDEIDYDKCIICQGENKSSPLRNPGIKGWKDS